MNRTIYLLIFFLLANIQSKANDRNVSFSDSLLKRIELNPNDSTLNNAFLKQISVSMYNNSDATLRQVKIALKLTQTSSDYRTIARLNMYAGIIFDLKGFYDSAFIFYEQGLAIAEKYDLKICKGELCNNYSITLAVTGQMERSIVYALKALDIFESARDSILLGKIYNNLGSRYSELQYYQKALEYYHKASFINERLKDNKKLAYNYGNIGLLYYDMNQNEKALEYFRKSLLLQDTLVNRYDYSIALHNLGLAYQRLNQYETALVYEKRSYEIACEINDELGKVVSLNGIASNHLLMGLLKEALEYFNQSEVLAQKLGARFYIMKIYEGKANIYAQLSDFQEAYKYNKRLTLLKDSIMTLEKDKAVQKIKEFENDKKQQEILLLTKDSEIQKLSVKRQKIIRNSVSVVGVLILILAILLLHRYRYVRRTRNELADKNKIINYEKERSDKLLLNILPAETAEELKETGTSKARFFDMVTVMFTDFKGFTYLAEKMSAQELVYEINHCFKAFDQIISEHNVEKIKTIGDAYMCAGGLPVPNSTNPVDVVRAALKIQQFMDDLKFQKKSEGKPYFELRLGIHTGPVVAGVVGFKKFQYDIWGDTVNIASRMESSGETGKVNISQNTYEKVKDHFMCVYRGKIEAKNKGLIDMYFVEN